MGFECIEIKNWIHNNITMHHVVLAWWRRTLPDKMVHWPLLFVWLLAAWHTCKQTETTSRRMQCHINKDTFVKCLDTKTDKISWNVSWRKRICLHCAFYTWVCQHACVHVCVYMHPTFDHSCKTWIVHRLETQMRTAVRIHWRMHVSIHPPACLSSAHARTNQQSLCKSDFLMVRNV